MSQIQNESDDHNHLLCFVFEHGQVKVRIQVDALPGCGGVVWPAGQHLANYLSNRGPDSLRGKQVLELGSGTGFVGLVAAMLGATVCITDQSSMLDIMRRNVSLNNLSQSVTVVELNWGHRLLEAAAALPPPNLILAADCVYLEETFAPLVQTLSDASDENTEILFCYQKRRKADRRFFSLLRKKFSWIDISTDPHHSPISLFSLSKKVSKAP